MATVGTGKCLEFQDVLYLIDNSNKCGFFTNSFTKETTAKRRLFFNSKSFHPVCILKSIVFDEFIRLRRFNETDELYLKDLKKLKTKCIALVSKK